MKTDGMNKANLNARISRVTPGEGPDYFELRVEDEASGLMVVTLKLDDSQFANLLSNRSAHRCDGEVNLSDRLLKKHEHKTVHIAYEWTLGADNQNAFEQVFIEAEKENEGWKADHEKKYNSYRHNRQTNTYEVTLRRWV